MTTAELHEGEGTYLMGQTSPPGTVFTRIAPAARQSKMPSHSGRGAAPIGLHDPFLMGWDTKVTADGVPKHRPSEILKRGLPGFLSGAATRTSC